MEQRTDQRSQKKVSNGSKKAWSWFSMFTPDMGMAKSPNLSRLQIGVGRDPNTCRRWTLRVKTNEMKMNDNKWEVMDLG